MDYNNNHHKNQYHYKGGYGKRLKTNNFNSFKQLNFDPYNEAYNVDKMIFTNRNSNPGFNINTPNDNCDLIQPNSLPGNGDSGQKNNSSLLEVQNFNRLFILYPKEASKEELTKAFERFGKIQAISIIKDQNTQTEKGIVYIEYAKASEALTAMEEMNGKYLENYRSKTLRVLISQEGNKSFRTNKPFVSKLHVQINKNVNKFDLKKIFRKYGEIQSSYISFDRVKKESRGFGYVTFLKSSDAARAVEECNPCFNVRFAFTNLQTTQDKNGQQINPNTTSLDMDQRITDLNDQPQQIASNFDHLTNTQSKEKENIKTSNNNFRFDFQKFINIANKSDDSVQPEEMRRDTRSVLVNNSVSEVENPFSEVDQQIKSDFVLRVRSKLGENFVHSMFNLIPGLQMFKQQISSGQFVVKYSNDLITYYAMKKLNNFELPSGEVTFSAEYIKESELNSSDTMAHKNIDQIFVYITFEKEMTNDILLLIMNQFKNLNTCQMFSDNKSGFALFSSHIDAMLAVNTLDNRKIAKNHLHAKIEPNIENILFNTNRTN